MFSVRQLSVKPCSTVLSSLETFTERVSVNEDGKAVFERVSDFLPLPDVDNFDLDRLLKSGVPLQETRTNILSPNLHDFVDAFDEQDIFEQKKEEQVNE